MKTCNFSINYIGNFEILFSRIISECKKVKAMIAGNSLAGEFNITILGLRYKGDYNRDGNNIEINISQKLFFISCETIKEVVIKYLS